MSDPGSSPDRQFDGVARFVFWFITGMGIAAALIIVVTLVVLGSARYGEPVHAATLFAVSLAWVNWDRRCVNDAHRGNERCLSSSVSP